MTKLLPTAYRWLAGEPGPRMVREGVRLHGTVEMAGAASNSTIDGWMAEMRAAGLATEYGRLAFTDQVPWCGLFMAVVAVRADPERRPERMPPPTFLWARSWARWGKPALAPMLGDVLVFRRPGGGGHVGIYVAEDATAFHVLGGNQSDAVSIARLARSRVIAVRRPAYRRQPANVRRIFVPASGALSTNEA